MWGRCHALVIINHIHVFGNEFVGPVCKGLFVTAQTLGIALRNVGPHHRLHPAVCRLFKGEATASDFQLLTFEKDFYEDLKADKAACAALNANAKDICVQEAKAKETIARGELESSYSGKAADQTKVLMAKAQSFQWKVAPRSSRATKRELAIASHAGIVAQSIDRLHTPNQPLALVLPAQAAIK